MRSDEFPGRIIAIDWGEKRIGIAISDETQTLARPLSVVISRSRKENAEKIAQILNENEVAKIIVGVTYDQNGELTPSGRRAERLAEAMRHFVACEVNLFDESRSTKIAKENKIIIGSKRKKRRGHLDADAAAIFLQDYLNRINDDR